MRRLVVLFALCLWSAAPGGYTQAAEPTAPAQWVRAAHDAVLADDIYLRDPATGRSAFARLHPGWTVVHHPSVGLLYAWRYTASSRKLVVVFRGTVSAHNWIEDVDQGLGGRAESGAALRENARRMGIEPAQRGGARDLGRLALLPDPPQAQGIYTRSQASIRQLLAHLGAAPSRMVFVGHSLGGGLAQYNALFYPHRAEVYAYNPAALSTALLAASGLSAARLAPQRTHLYSTLFIGAGCEGVSDLACKRVPDAVSKLTPLVEALDVPAAVQLAPLQVVPVSERRVAWPLGLRVTATQRNHLRDWMVPLMAALLRPPSGESEAPVRHHGFLAALAHPLRAGVSMEHRLMQASLLYQQDVRADDNDLVLLYLRRAHSMRLLRNGLCMLADLSDCARPNLRYDVPDVATARP